MDIAVGTLIVLENPATVNFLPARGTRIGDEDETKESSLVFILFPEDFILRMILPPEDGVCAPSRFALRICLLKSTLSNGGISTASMKYRLPDSLDTGTFVSSTSSSLLTLSLRFLPKAVLSNFPFFKHDGLAVNTPSPSSTPSSLLSASNWRLIAVDTFLFDEGPTTPRGDLIAIRSITEGICASAAGLGDAFSLSSPSSILLLFDFGVVIEAESGPALKVRFPAHFGVVGVAEIEPSGAVRNREGEVGEMEGNLGKCASEMFSSRQAGLEL